MIKNIERINEIKRNRVLDILKFVEKSNIDGVIQKIIIFGSAVTEHCKSESDIDICLVSDYDSKNNTFFYIFGKIPIVANDLCDVVLYSKIKNELKEEVDKKGVVIYEYK